jgi:hypothetical protein
MKVGDVVRNKSSGQYGTVEYSTFGFSIHMWNEDHSALGKTLGDKPSEVKKYWEVAELPDGYEVLQYGGVRKKG